MGLNDQLTALNTAIESVGSTIANKNGTFESEINALTSTVNGIALIRGLFNALKLTAPGTGPTVTITALAMVLKDNSGHAVALSNVNTQASTSNPGSTGTGAYSLDTGIFTINTWYSVWVIYNPTTTQVAGIFSLSAANPQLSNGYTHYARVGWIRTDGGAHGYPLSFQQKGAEVRYKVAAGSNVAALPILASGAEGDCTIPTWVALDWTPYAPPTINDLKLLTGSNGTNCTVMVAPNNGFGAWNSVTNLPPVMHSNVSSYLFTDDELTVESDSIYWASNAGAQPPTPGSAGNSGILCVMGWTDNI